MNNTLLKYIKEQRKLGISDVPIMQTLTDQGWPEQDVLDAMRDDRSFPKPPLINISLTPAQKKIAIIVGGGAFCCIIIIVVFVVLLWKSGSKGSANKQNNAKDSKTEDGKKQPTDPKTTNEPTTKSPAQQADLTGNLVVFYHQTDSKDPKNKGSIIFYDLSHDKKLPAFKELESAEPENIRLSPWSPDGRYIAIYVPAPYYVTATPEDTDTIYLFDAKDQSIKELIKRPSLMSESTDKLLYHLKDGFRYSFWIDAERIGFGRLEATSETSELMFLTIKGKLGKDPAEKTSMLFGNYEQNTELSFVTDSAEIQNDDGSSTTSQVYRDITLQGSKIELELYDKPIAAIGRTILTLRLPALDPSQIPKEILQEIQEKFSSNGATLKDLLIEYEEYFTPKEHGKIIYVNGDSGGEITTIDLSDESGWYTISGYYEPKRKLFYLSQIDKAINSKTMRFVQFNPLNREIQTISDRNLTEAESNMSIALSALHSFQMSADGNYIIWYDRSEATSSIQVANIDSKKPNEICSGRCENLQVYNPNQFQKKWSIIQY